MDKIFIILSFFFLAGFGYAQQVDPIEEALRLLKLQKTELVKLKDTNYLQKQEIIQHKNNAVVLKTEIATFKKWGEDQYEQAKIYYKSYEEEKIAKEKTIERYHSLKNKVAIVFAALGGFIGFHLGRIFLLIPYPPYNIIARWAAIPLVAGLLFWLSWLIF